MKSAKKGKTLSEFEQSFGQPKLKRLERELEIERQKVQAVAGKRVEVHVYKQTDNTVRFGLIGDTHYGSLYDHTEGVQAFYERCRAEGIKRVLHAGDVLDGWRIYKGQEFELRDVGFNAQLARMQTSAPMGTGITTEFITGNHDSSFTALVGLNVGRAIQEKRPDWKHLGQDHAMVRFVTPKGAYDVMLLHPDGGTAYALSYRPQKIVEQLEGGKKPNMVAIGHYHKSEFIPSYRNVAMIQVGTFCWQTPFMVRKGLSAHVGGWIVEVSVGESWNIVKAEFVAFYR
jgi:hypothetical protein